MSAWVKTGKKSDWAENFCFDRKSGLLRLDEQTA
jgi:hypothetical protein